MSLISPVTARPRMGRCLARVTSCDSVFQATFKVWLLRAAFEQVVQRA